MNGFGENIKKYRKIKKLTQEELGFKVNVTKSYVSKVESERTVPSLEMLANIAAVLEIDLVDLFDNKQRPPREIMEAGGDWIILGEELEKEGITPEQVKAWAEIVKKHLENKT